MTRQTQEDIWMPKMYIHQYSTEIKKKMILNIYKE